MIRSSKQRIILAVAVLVIGTVVSAQAADNWNEFYQFRHSSTLPGNLFGVTTDGQVGFEGALLQNVPVAYTPCSGNWVLGGNSGSNNSGLHLGWGGDKVNGTALLGVGLGKSGRGIYLSEMVTGTDICPAYNIQIQVMAETFDHPAVAVGVQDILNQRQRMVGHPHGARSAYAVITGKIGPAERPTYITLGWGGGRFSSSPFGGISMPLSNMATLVGEYDGFNTNAGLAWSLLSRPAQRQWGAIGYLGWSDLERPVVGFTLTRKKAVLPY